MSGWNYSPHWTSKGDFFCNFIGQPRFSTDQVVVNCDNPLVLELQYGNYHRCLRYAITFKILCVQRKK